MSGLILDTKSTIICPHGGLISPIASNIRVFVNGQPAVTQSDTFLVAGCVLIFLVYLTLVFHLDGYPLL